MCVRAWYCTSQDRASEPGTDVDRSGQASRAPFSGGTSAVLYFTGQGRDKRNWALELIGQEERAGPCGREKAREADALQSHM